MFYRLIRVRRVCFFLSKIISVVTMWHNEEAVLCFPSVYLWERLLVCMPTVCSFVGLEPQAFVNHQMWVLRTKSGSSTRWPITINHWSVPPAPIGHNFWSAFFWPRILKVWTPEQQPGHDPRECLKCVLLGFPNPAGSQILGWIQLCVWIDSWGEGVQGYFTVENIQLK